MHSTHTGCICSRIYTLTQQRHFVLQLCLSTTGPGQKCAHEFLIAFIELADMEMQEAIPKAFGAHYISSLSAKFAFCHTIADQEQMRLKCLRTLDRHGIRLC